MAAGSSSWPGAGERHDLWLVRLDGKPGRGLAKSILTEEAPAYSPDGQWVAFLRFATDGRSTTAVVIGVDGSDERTLSGSFGFSGLMPVSGRRQAARRWVDPAIVFRARSVRLRRNPAVFELPGSPPRLMANQYELPAWQRRAQ